MQEHVVEHTQDLAERMGNLFLDDKTADVILVVEGECVAAHRAILSTSCEFFRALFYGNMKESLQNEVVLKDVALRGFKLVMSYIYSGLLRVNELDDDTLVEVLLISHMYGIGKLEKSLTKYIKENVSLKNVCMIFDKAYSLKLEDLREACYRFMIQEPSVILKSEAFCNLSEAALCHMLSWDTFNGNEIEIFEAVLRWRAKRPPDQDLWKVLEQIRLPLINTRYLATTVRHSGLIPTEVLMDAISTRKGHEADRNFRGSLRTDVNLATAECGARRLTAKIRSEYSEAGSYLDYDTEVMPPFKSVSSFPAATGFMLALSEAFFINHIGFEIQGGTFECSYYVEVSVNLIDWTRVIDFSKYACCSHQNLHFERRVARYIRVIATERKTLRIKIAELEVSYTSKPFKLSHGFYAPEQNVSSLALGAYVIRSLDESQALINYQSTVSGKSSEWTSHKIGDDGIFIQLPHPYTVGSMRMLLRSDDSRAYKYIVQTSLDFETWTLVADHTTNFRQSWQHFTFEALPVLYIMIYGTASTVDEVFTCARFECPAPLKDLKETNNPGTGTDVTKQDLGATRDK